MVSKEQYEFFVRLFDEESRRTASLNDRAKWYLSLTSLYSAAIIFISEKLRPYSTIQLFVLILSNAGMLLSFMLSLWAVRISAFEGITIPSIAIEQLQRDGFDQDKFYLNRIADFSIAAQRNSNLNDRQAKTLTIAGAIMLIGMLAHGVYFYMRLSPGADHEQSTQANQIVLRWNSRSKEGGGTKGGGKQAGAGFSIEVRPVVGQ
jgi:hypothetical protein